jgi:predicted nucleic acid-binding protein
MMGIKKLRLYLETTVFNYYFDTDRDGHEDTVRLFEAISAGEFEGYTSRYAVSEIEMTSEPKCSKMLDLILKYSISVFDFDEVSKLLANRYISERVFTENQRLDSLHVAIASVHGLDCLISYNFKHINRSRTKVYTTKINQEEGYNGVVILTSGEVLNIESLQFI